MEKKHQSDHSASQSPKSYDCLWLVFGESHWRDESIFLKDLDWKLRGQLRRVMSQSNPGSLVFYPTMGKVPERYVVVDRRKVFEREKFVTSCEGMAAKRVLLAHEKENVIKKSDLPKSVGDLEITVESVL